MEQPRTKDAEPGPPGPRRDVAKPEILLVEDNPGDAFLVSELLSPRYDVRLCKSLRCALDAIPELDHPIFLTDLSLPDATGLEAVEALRNAARDAPLIVLSGSTDESTAIAAMKLGAQDYIVKGVADADSLHRTIRYAAERKRSEKRLVYLASHDPLTGLLNRAAFADSLKLAMTRSRRTGCDVALLYIDLDGFKEVNDSYGHQAGDTLLREVAARIGRAVREVDTVGRLGGDEFAVALEGAADPQMVTQVAARILDLIARPVECAGSRVTVGASIGIGQLSAGRTSIDALLRQADQAMYAAKHAGGSRFTYFDDTRRTLSVEQQLATALRDHRFLLHYQAQFASTSGNPVGAEALLRMHLEDGTLVFPDFFISTLERSELLVEVGDWTLDIACGCAAQWRNAGIGQRIAVNVAERQLTDTNLPCDVERLLSKHAIPGSTLELELTERTLVRDVDATRSVLSDLRTLGVRVAIDDFGTGYSSLAYLEDFAIDVLKIDRRFINKIQDNNGGSIASAVIGMSHVLGLEVVGEGVETPRQLRFLRDAGCDIVQGYHLARPSAQWLPDIARAA